jgi:hypothetical protein
MKSLAALKKAGFWGRNLAGEGKLAYDEGRGECHE